MELTIGQAVEKLTGQLAEFKDKTTAEAKAAASAVQTALDALKGKEVKELTDKLTEQEATLGQMVLEVKELKAKRARPGAGDQADRGSILKDISKMLLEKKDVFEGLAKGGSLTEIFEIKAPGVVTTGSLANGNYIDYLDWRPGMEPTGQIRFREQVRQVQSAFDNVKYPRANNPVGLGSFQRQQNEGDQKSQVDRGYTFIDLNLKAMAGWITVTRQSLRNIPFLQTWLPTSLNEQLLDTEDTEFGATLFQAATGSTTTPSLTVNIERIIGFITNLLKKKFKANGIVIDPAIWAEILVTKPSNYSLPNVVTIDANGTVRVLGMPLNPVNWLGAGQVLLGDWTKAAIVESEGLNFRQSDNVASQFTANEITFLLERTNGLAIFRPDAFVAATVS